MAGSWRPCHKGPGVSVHFLVCKHWYLCHFDTILRLATHVWRLFSFQTPNPKPVIIGTGSAEWTAWTCAEPASRFEKFSVRSVASMRQWTVICCGKFSVGWWVLNPLIEVVFSGFINNASKKSLFEQFWARMVLKRRGHLWHGNLVVFMLRNSGI